ncbi:DUF359 domain-containing protein [Candidatus Bathyarchaeota archaeon]|nr:DUF359 domain-containing protein [Candidatus Bathyarchaeota archaeon]
MGDLGRRFLRVLTDELRVLLKKPVGILVRGEPWETVVEVRRILEAEKPPKTVAVGDVVSETLLETGLEADLYITDAKSLRVEREEPKLDAIVDQIQTVVNPPGHISSEAEEAVRTCLRSSRRCWIKVRGEEDLLALVAIAEVPLGSVVLYGQPGEGVVVVCVDEAVKQWARTVIESMPVVQANC